MVVPHQKVHWVKEPAPTTDRVLFILFHIPCWERHTLSFKMGMPLLQASLHMENFSLTKPYDWAGCVHPKLAFSASHLGKWLIMESHRWLLPSSEHYSWQDTRRRKHSWLFKVDASLWWLTQALSKDFVVRSPSTWVPLPICWLAWDHSSGAWDEKLAVEKALAWPRGPHVLF